MLGWWYIYFKNIHIKNIQEDYINWKITEEIEGIVFFVTWNVAILVSHTKWVITGCDQVAFNVNNIVTKGKQYATIIINRYVVKLMKKGDVGLE